jgi:hypothetical protein
MGMRENKFVPILIGCAHFVMYSLRLILFVVLVFQEVKLNKL